MNWHTLASTLVGALITFSAILFTQALDLRKQTRARKKLIHALLQGLQDEIAGLLELASSGAARPIDAVPEGKPYEGMFTANQDYFTVYHTNTGLVMQMDDADLRRRVIQTYMRAKVLLDTICMNRLYLERYHYLQSTFLKTKDPSVQVEAEEYRRTLIDTAVQLKRVDADFRSSSSDLLSKLSAGIKRAETLMKASARNTAVISASRNTRGSEAPMSTGFAFLAETNRGVRLPTVSWQQLMPFNGEGLHLSQTSPSGGRPPLVDLATVFRSSEATLACASPRQCGSRTLNG
jgi:hypothetical protein